MSLFNNNYTKAFRAGNLEIYCKEVTLSQDSLENGFVLSGHGVIKVKKGLLCLDVVITDESKWLPWGGVYIPSDPTDISGYFSMQAQSLTGSIIRSSGLRIKMEMFYIGDQAKRFIIPLSSISTDDIASSVNIRKWKKSITLEFLEYEDIPKNKVNKTESTLGEMSISTNQTLIEEKDYIFNLITKDGFSTLFFATNSLDLDTLHNAVLFYIGFTSGKIPQPYIIRKRDELESTSTLNSIDVSQIYQIIPPPIQSNIIKDNGSSFNSHHYELLKSIISICQRDMTVFNCIYEHWHRVWHSFQSKADSDSVPGLTITTSIEGLLNDIFIPALQEEIVDKDFEVVKANIISKIEFMEGITSEHKKNIINYVKKWGNLFPKKALEILVEKNVVSKEETNAWSKLRHSLAHPRNKALDVKKQQEQTGRVLSCLGIFYKLILNTFKYDGAYTKYKANGKSEIVHLVTPQIAPCNKIPGGVT